MEDVKVAYILNALHVGVSWKKAGTFRRLLLKTTPKQKAIS